MKIIKYLFWLIMFIFALCLIVKGAFLWFKPLGYITVGVIISNIALAGLDGDD